MSTTHTVTLPTPDGSEADVTITVHWTHEKNPCGKDAAHDRGEDDGWVAESIEPT